MSGLELFFWIALAGWQILATVIVLYSFAVSNGEDDE